MLAGCPTWPQEFAERYRQEGCWRGETFGEMLRERAKAYGERIAIVSGERRISYAELDDRTDRLAEGLLGIGIEPQDRVVVQLPNIAEFFEVIFALFRIGALPVFALPLHRRLEISYISEFSEAKAYIIAGQDAGFDYRELAREVIREVPSLRHVLVAGEAQEFVALEELYGEPREPKMGGEAETSANKRDENGKQGGRRSQPHPGDIAFLQLSGGTTGLPKLIPRTHDDYIYSLRLSAEICGLNDHSVYLAVLPAAHNYPLSSPGVLGTLYAGGRVVLARGASPDEAFPLLLRERVTITALVPPLALIWLDAAERQRIEFPHLQVLQVGGAKFSAEAAARVKPTLGCQLQQVFGMAEGLVNYTRLDDPDEVIVHTQGRPMSPWDEVRVVDDEDNEVPPGEAGHLLTRGPYTIRGYYRAEEHNAKAFTSDGFYRTGDIVRINSDGHLIVEGRDKDQINRGGEKIAAEEVENQLLAHPGVHDAAVVAMPDEYLGERTCAFVIPHPAADTPLSGVQIKAFLRGRGLAAFKIPDRIEFIDSFPKTKVGKVSKKALRELIAEKQRG
ncbi:(2,3-dihydroxybenzoyl)adenylate synthase [Paenibacillus sp. FSL W8-0186]|uniref:Long-chain-fatty-acid--CoA ligase n=1 Tax=Paenibacillus woosongensis TaxID=307580 RepID=A0ABQ4ML05_9BACL|nr:(2,3-dihydroxybenzoyl)adenylate synthase [Paenibacillus woosongensis]GIP56663.1 2,3-dihydroxybenzoate-AMP ligase [Paenibacillus woosongensis]